LVLRPTSADSLSVSVFSTANSFSFLSVSIPVSSRLRICTPHAVYDSWGPRAGGGACSLLRRGERNSGKEECRYTASVLRRRMRRLLESEIVTQSMYNADAEWDGECCWSWSNVCVCVFFFLHLEETTRHETRPLSCILRPCRAACRDQEKLTAGMQASCTASTSMHDN
jgi:hypothetical protein